MSELDAGLAGAPNTKPFSNGNFLVWRKVGQQLRKGLPSRKDGNPRFRHPTREAAEAEATRLLGLFPESTFIILQEVARVKNGPTPEPKRPTDDDPAHVFDEHAQWVRENHPDDAPQAPDA